MKIYAKARRLEDIDWASWEAVHPATLVFVIRDEKILLIRKKTGLGPVSYTHLTLPTIYSV